MTMENRGRITVALREKLFHANPTIDTARSLFLACQKYSLPFPRAALATIIARCNEEEERYREAQNEWLSQQTDKIADAEALLSMALNSATLKSAYASFRCFLKEKKRNETPDDHALRKRLERDLDSRFKILIDQTGDVGAEAFLKDILAESLINKLDIYKDIVKNV